MKDLDVKFLISAFLSNVVCSLKETGRCSGISGLNHRASGSSYFTRYQLTTVLALVGRSREVCISGKGCKSFGH